MLPSEERAIREREAAACPGPWSVRHATTDRRGLEWWADFNVPFADAGDYPEDTTLMTREADAVFIAHARQDIPALLAEIDWLRQLLHDAREDSLAYQAGLRDGRASVGASPLPPTTTEEV